MHYEVVLIDRETAEIMTKLLVTNDVDEAADKTWEYNSTRFGDVDCYDLLMFVHDKELDINPEEKLYADYFEIEDEEDRKEKEKKIMNNKINEIIEKANNDLVDWNSPKTEMVGVGVYKDSTGLYTEAECDEDNWVELEFPKAIVEEWYWTTMVHVFNPGYTMERWLKEVSSDETEQCDLIGFAKEKGFVLKRHDGKDAFVISIMEQILYWQSILSENDMYNYVEENLTEAIECAKLEGNLYDLDYMIHLKKLLNMSISYKLYSYIDDKYDGSILELDEKDINMIRQWIVEYVKGE